MSDAGGSSLGLGTKSTTSEPKSVAKSIASSYAHSSPTTAKAKSSKPKLSNHQSNQSHSSPRYRLSVDSAGRPLQQQNTLAGAQQVFRRITCFRTAPRPYCPPPYCGYGGYGGGHAYGSPPCWPPYPAPAFASAPTYYITESIVPAISTGMNQPTSVAPQPQLQPTYQTQNGYNNLGNAANNNNEGNRRNSYDSRNMYGNGNERRNSDESKRQHRHHNNKLEDEPREKDKSKEVKGKQEIMKKYLESLKNHNIKKHEKHKHRDKKEEHKKSEVGPKKSEAPKKSEVADKFMKQSVESKKSTTSRRETDEFGKNHGMPGNPSFKAAGEVVRTVHHLSKEHSTFIPPAEPRKSQGAALRASGPAQDASYLNIAHSVMSMESIQSSAERGFYSKNYDPRLSRKTVGPADEHHAQPRLTRKTLGPEGAHSAHRISRKTMGGYEEEGQPRLTRKTLGPYEEEPQARLTRKTLGPYEEEPQARLTRKTVGPNEEETAQPRLTRNTLGPEDTVQMLYPPPGTRISENFNYDTSTQMEGQAPPSRKTGFKSVAQAARLTNHFIPGTEAGAHYPHAVQFTSSTKPGSVSQAPPGGNPPGPGRPTAVEMGRKSTYQPPKQSQ